MSITYIADKRFVTTQLYKNFNIINPFKTNTFLDIVFNEHIDEPILNNIINAILTKDVDIIKSYINKHYLKVIRLNDKQENFSFFVELRFQINWRKFINEKKTKMMIGNKLLNMIELNFVYTTIEYQNENKLHIISVSPSIDLFIHETKNKEKIDVIENIKFIQNKFNDISNIYLSEKLLIPETKIHTLQSYDFNGFDNSIEIINCSIDQNGITFGLDECKQHENIYELNTHAPTFVRHSNVIRSDYMLCLTINDQILLVGNITSS